MATGPRPTIAPTLTESDLQASIVDLAVVLGWRSYHTFDSRRSNAGFPDLVLYRDHRLIFAELKSAKGRLAPEQEATLDALMLTPAEVHVWRPIDWFDGTIEGVLK